MAFDRLRGIFIANSGNSISVQIALRVSNKRKDVIRITMSVHLQEGGNSNTIN